jgi:hypothetical protein
MPVKSNRWLFADNNLNFIILQLDSSESNGNPI